MKRTLKPTRLVSRLWVFSCLVASSLTSCQPSAPTPRQPSAQPLSQPPPAKKTKPISNTAFEGLTLEAATAKATQANQRWRVVRVDGKSRPVTKDYRPSRLNFEIQQGKVIRVTKG